MSTWIFLRGLTREARHWGDFPDRFRARLPEAHVHTLDLPGNGAHYGVASPLSVDAMADFCRRDVETQGVAMPCRLLAMSLGAMVAAAWAAAYPREVAGCVLINTSLRPFNPFQQRLRPRNYPLLLRLALRGTDDRAWEEAIYDLTSGRPDHRAETVDRWVDYRRSRPVSRSNALRQLAAAALYRAPIKPPPVPMLVLASAADALVDPRCSRRLAPAWCADFAEHPDAGHDIPLDDGDWVARQVGQWAALPR
jgi:pimeloyl-ACP methyl ester carboxylesterase